MTVLVGVDGSGPAARALAWAVDLVGTLHSPLVIATVYVADPTDASGWDHAHDRARRQLDDLGRPARAAGIPSEAVLLDGESGPALRAAADQHHAGLTVVGRRGCGGFDAMVAGSTADYLARHTRTPLAIIPPDGSPSPPRHLLLALDGSAESATAAAWAAQLATGLDATVSAAFVPTPPELYGRLTTVQVAAAEDALIGRWTAPLREVGLSPVCRVLQHRHPADALIELAMEIRADAIVAGTRAVGGLRRIRLGGVTMQLFHHSHVPVIAVPPPRS